VYWIVNQTKTDPTRSFLFGKILKTFTSGERMNDPKNIKKKYFTVGSPAEYSSLTTFLKNSKFKDKLEVEKVLSDLKTYSVHKNIRKNYPRRKLMVMWTDDTWTMDIVDLLSLKFSNSHFGYILVLMDSFSRYLWSFPLKFKNAESVHMAFESLFKKTKRRCSNLWSDADKAFFNKKMDSLLKRENIHLYHTFSKKKAFQAELMVRPQNFFI